MRKLLLVALLVNGLVPSFGELVEMSVHRIVTGHLPHLTEAEDDLGDQGSEHGCGSTAHICECCASAEVTPAVLAKHAPKLAPFGRVDRAGTDPQTEDHSRLLFRPPIVS